MLPLMGSPTASIWVTGGLAILSFLMMHGAAIVKVGPIRYVKSIWPHVHLGDGIVINVISNVVFSLPLFVIEMVGTVIKSGVLAVRLFANMFAGHLVLANVLLFIQVAGNAAFGMWAGVTGITVFGVVALSLLELFVAFLQAYVFTFLTALFMGMSLHPEH